MIASDFRIGNYVNDNLYGTEVQITLNHFKEETFELTEPIPITEKWLLKFGFEKDGSYFNINNFHYNLETNKIYIGNDHVSSGHDDTEIIYVHQIQNLYFALYHKELKIY